MVLLDEFNEGSPTMSFDRLFQTPDAERQRFLSGLFSLFCADIIRCWAADRQAPYKIPGTPLLREINGSRGYTLDYALQTPKRLYVAMLRCDPVTDGPLNSAAQIEAQATTKAFAAFLEAARYPMNYVAIINGQEMPVAGSILIWSSASLRAQRAVKKTYGLYDVLTMEGILGDLAQWQNHEFQMLLDRRIAWGHDFYRGLRQIK
jgi:hypothetical protein